jgi:hypothetical protein
MKPVQQTRLGAPQGNCLMAAVASLLEVALEECPDLYEAEQRGENYWTVMAAFLRSRGFQPVWMTPDFLGGCSPRGYAAVAGPGARGVDHVCVAKDGEIVHDPLPQGGGLRSVTGYIVLVPICPASGETPATGGNR